MEPFSIACTTCQARLRVRDESVVGQILTCPKCGSMVLVEPVASISESARHPEAPSSRDTHEMTGTSLASDNTSQDTASVHHAEPSPDPNDMTDTVEDLSVPAASRLADHEVDTDPRPSSAWENESLESDQTQDDAVSSLQLPPPRPQPTEVLLPSDDWTSPSALQWRNRALTGIAAVVGVALALMLLIVFSGGEAAPLNEAVSVASELDSNSDREFDAPVAIEREPIVLSDAIERIASDSESPSAAPAPESDTEFEPSPVPRVEVVSELPSPAPERSGPAPGDTLPTPVAPPSDEPPGLTPKEPTSATAGSEPSPLSATLREFGALFDETKEPTTPEPAVDNELPAIPDPDQSEGERVVPRGGPRVVEVDDRLHDPVAQIDFDGVPLANFLRFVSDYSTIPITLDADILRWTGVSPHTPVKLKASDATVTDILTQGLAPLGLEHRIDAGQLFVTRRPISELGIRTVTFKVDDLIGDKPLQLERLGTRIMDFVAPASWSSRGGVGTVTYRDAELIVEQHETVQFEVLAFCERLRIARGLRTRSAYDVSMFQVETRSQQARVKLEVPIRLTYIRPASLHRILDRIAQTSGLHILIDWRELGKAGWSPDAEIRFSVADQPVARALESLLEPMGLAYRVVDGSTLQVTTPSVLDSRLEVEFHRVPVSEEDGARLVRTAMDALGPAGFREFGGSGQLEFDEPSGCLLACLSQSRQMELQAWLAAQDADATSSTSVGPTTPTASVEATVVAPFDRGPND